MDRLCNALADKLEKENTVQTVTMEPTQQVKGNHHFVSQYPTLEHVLMLSGIPNPEVRQAYAQLLADNGFETTQLLLGVSGNSKLLQDIGLKMGHSLRPCSVAINLCG